jgi:CheY-like chemotaxis protein
VSVRDSGPGLPEEVRDTLFDRYVGAEAEDTGAIGVSTGIGLALVKELAEQHGGSVAAESEQGFGTEITVTLPADCAALPEEDIAGDAGKSDLEPAVEPELDRISVAAGASEPGNGETEGQAVVAGPSDDRPTVLVVDDEASVRSYLQDVLTPRYAVRTAADGEEGLKAARENRPDLVISDVVMPKRDGYRLCRALRADDGLRGVPIVLLTVQDEQEDRLEGLREGADAYVGKPFHPEELRQRVENLIGIRRYLQSRSQQAPTGGGPDANQAEDKPGKEEGTEPAVGEESEFLQEVRATVEEHVGNSSFGVEWLADEVGLSTRQLQRRLQEEVGLSAAAYIRATRLERAAELLERGKVTTVTEAASAVGYRDASYFSQLFKETHGKSPSKLKG